MPLLSSTYSVSIYLHVNNESVSNLDPVTRTTFPFMLGRSLTGLNTFEGAAPPIPDCVERVKSKFVGHHETIRNSKITECDYGWYILIENL